ncbi:MAG TPA: DUF4145 domain-containing protein [Thermoanaerobaculia bacterium]|nr:DUF4145 domain-containing protein [Thermoanaerobaculia bacterium]
MKERDTSAFHWQELFQKEFSKESDRAAVILAAAMLEQALESLLRARLVAIASDSDPLFDGPYAPVSTFSAKIDLAFRIGLLSSRVARDLHLVRKIRNSFAHNVTGCNFDDAIVRNRATELIRSQGVVEGAPDIRSEFDPGFKGDFQMTVAWMIFSLWYEIDTVQEIPQAEYLPFSLPQTGEPPREAPESKKGS